MVKNDFSETRKAREDDLKVKNVLMSDGRPGGSDFLMFDKPSATFCISLSVAN